MVSQNMNVTMYNFLNAREGYPLFCIFATYATVAINLVLNFLFIPKIGIVGAAISFSIAHTLRMCLLSRYLFSKTDLNFMNFMVLQKSDISNLNLLRYWKTKR